MGTGPPNGLAHWQICRSPSLTWLADVSDSGDPTARRRRPRVVVLMWASLDARISLGRNRPGQEFASLAFTASVQDVFRRVKATVRPGATLSGSGSILAGAGPLPANHRQEKPLTPVATQTEDYLPPHVVDRADRKGWFVVPDSRGLITWGQVEDEESQHFLVLAARVTPPDYLQHLRERGIPHIVAGEGRVDLEEALTRLSGRLEVSTVLSEGGERLNGALLRRGLVDEVNVVIVPTLVADEHAPTMFDAATPRARRAPTTPEIAALRGSRRRGRVAPIRGGALRVSGQAQSRWRRPPGPSGSGGFDFLGHRDEPIGHGARRSPLLYLDGHQREAPELARAPEPGQSRSSNRCSCRSRLKRSGALSGPLPNCLLRSFLKSRRGTRSTDS